jgi:hypothetical protein
MMSRYIHSVFCEDIRQETGRKFSLNGVFGASLVLPEDAEILSKLCAVSWISTPLTRPIKAVYYYIEYNREKVIEQHFDVGELPPPKKGGRAVIMMHAVLNNFPVMKGGVLRVRAKIDGGPIQKGGSLKIVIDSNEHAKARDAVLV